MTDLKQATIESISTEGAFDMADFGNVAELVEPSCNTACCIAGHIVHAAAKLGMHVPFQFKGPYGEDLFDAAKYQVAKHTLGLTSYDYNPTARTARALWAQVYGAAEADRLEFDDGWRTSFEDVTPAHAIAHLNGQTPDEAQGID